MGKNKKVRKYGCVMKGSNARTYVKACSNVNALVFEHIDSLKGDASEEEQEWYWNEFYSRVSGVKVKHRRESKC